jgi:hypothetical protein
VAGFTQTVGTLGTALADVDVVRANQYLDDADAPADDRFLALADGGDSRLWQTS